MRGSEQEGWRWTSGLKRASWCRWRKKSVPCFWKCLCCERVKPFGRSPGRAALCSQDWLLFLQQLRRNTRINAALQADQLVNVCKTRSWARWCFYPCSLVLTKILRNTGFTWTDDTPDAVVQSSVWCWGILWSVSSCFIWSGHSVKRQYKLERNVKLCSCVLSQVCSTQYTVRLSNYFTLHSFSAQIQIWNLHRNEDVMML